MHSTLGPEECHPDKTLWLVDPESLHVNTHPCMPQHSAVLPLHHTAKSWCPAASAFVTA